MLAIMCFIDFFLHLANKIFSLIENVLIVTDNSGKAYQLDLNHASNEDGFLCQQLPSTHQPGEMMYLFRLHGMMSPKGSLCSLSKTTSQCNYINLSAFSSFPCVVLLGLRAGYGSMLQDEQITSLSLYFTTWAFADNSLCA